MKIIPVEKNDELEQPVPTAWRFALKQLADKAVLGAEIDPLVNLEIGQIDSKMQSSHRYNMESYPDKLGSLGEKSWETSIYIWDTSFWSTLIDLSDENGDTTDLVLHAKVFETSAGYLIEPGLIYVP